MKKFAVIIILSAIIFSACQHHRALSDAIAEADAVVCTDPDSALAILSRADTVGAPDRLRAHYILLLTKAASKSYKERPNNKEIEFAANYYSNRTDSLNTQSAYYYGVDLILQKSYNEAICVLHDGFENAVKSNDVFYQAMIARELAGIYHTILMPKEAIKWSHLAKNDFIKLNKVIHAAWISRDIAEAQNSDVRPKEAISELNTIDKEILESDSILRHLVWLSYANAYSLLDNEQNSIEYRNRVYTETHHLKALDWAKLALSHHKLGNFVEADSTLNLARLYQQTRQDSLFIFYLDALFAERNTEPKVAYEKAMKWANEFARSNDNQIITPQTSLIIDYLSLKSQNRLTELRLTYAKLYLWIVIALILFIMGVGIYIIFSRRDKYRRIETESLVNDVLRLKKELHEKSEVGMSSPDLDPIFMNLLNDLFDIDDKSPRSAEGNSYLRKNLSSVLSSLSSEETFIEIEKIVNYYHDNIIQELRRQIPSLSDKLIRYFTLKSLGFSTTSICRILNLSSVNAVYQLKSRIKTAIESSNTENRDKFLSILNNRQ